MKIKAPKPLPIHEFDHADRHRIVIQDRNGVCDASDWFPITQTIHFKNIYAAGGLDAVLPPGLFSIRGVAYQLLV